MLTIQQSLSGRLTHLRTPWYLLLRQRFKITEEGMNLGDEQYKDSNGRGCVQDPWRCLSERKWKGSARRQGSWPSNRTYSQCSSNNLWHFITSVSQIYKCSFLFALKNKVPKGFFSMTPKACTVTYSCDSSTWTKAGRWLWVQTGLWYIASSRPAWAIEWEMCKENLIKLYEGSLVEAGQE